MARADPQASPAHRSESLTRQAGPLRRAEWARTDRSDVALPSPGFGQGLAGTSIRNPTAAKAAVTSSERPDGRSPQPLGEQLDGREELLEERAVGLPLTPRHGEGDSPDAVLALEVRFDLVDRRFLGQ